MTEQQVRQMIPSALYFIYFSRGTIYDLFVRVKHSVWERKLQSKIVNHLTSQYNRNKFVIETYQMCQDEEEKEGRGNLLRMKG